MSLTLKAEKKLGDAGLIDLFSSNIDEWRSAAARAIEYIQNGFPTGSRIRKDDVSMAMIPTLEVHEILLQHLKSNKLRQKFWTSDFADLIIDRLWDEIGGT